VEVGRYSYVKSPLIGPSKILSDRPAKLEIIFDGLFKACLELIHGTALEKNQVVDAFNPAVKILIIRAEVYGAQKALIVQNIFHRMIRISESP
jgi:L-cysteine desulfidase